MSNRPHHHGGGGDDDDVSAPLLQAAHSPPPSASSASAADHHPLATSVSSIASSSDPLSIPLRSRTATPAAAASAHSGSQDGLSALSLTDSSDPLAAAAGLDQSVNSQAGDSAAAAAPTQPEPEVRDLGEEMKFFSKQVYLLIIPIFLTFVLTIWWARTVFLEINISSNNALLVYQEQESDSTGVKIGGAILNALIILGCILVVTVIFVCLFYYNCMKIIFGWLITSTVLILGGIGGLIAFYLMYAYNGTLDWLTFALILWNFAVVGVLSIFWKAPLYVQQGYLVIISALTATNLLQLPEWTAFALLAVVAIYDLFAVLCPRGPLKILVNTAQERNQNIPALLYSAGMADVGKPKIGAYTAISTNDTDSEIDVQRGESSRPTDIEGSYQREGQEGETETPAADGQQPKKKSRFRRRQQQPQEPGSENAQAEEDDEPTGVQLGLGDFVFYSVLVGRAALTDWITIVTCSIACVTGLGLTLILLGIFQRALPALPISIALGIIFYFLTSLILTPLSDVLAQAQVFL